MQKYIYAVCCVDTNELESIYATSESDAKDRIMEKYSNWYENLEFENWEELCSELYDDYGITLSDVYEWEEL